MTKWLAILPIALLMACGPQVSDDAPITEREMSLMHLAQNMYKNGDIAEAIRLYERAIDKSGNRVQAHMALADIYNQMDKFDKATEVLLRAKKRQKNHELVNLGLAKLAVKDNDPEKAIDYFDDGLKSNKDNIDLLNGKAVALDMIGEHKQAQLIYYRVIDLNDKDSDFVQSNLAMSYIMNGEYDDAIAMLKAIGDMEKSPVMRQNLALAYGLKGNMKLARKWGLKDLTKKEFQENLDFYRNYTEELRAR